jgi:sirohydrochlorin ferrochelatase
MTQCRALIIAHGSPADPVPQECWMQALAARVRMWLPGWEVRGTTLALPGALESAIKGMPDALIYPFFMAEGWFTRSQLPKRLRAAGIEQPLQLPALGHDPGMEGLLRDVATAAAHELGLPDDASLILAAHGSQVSPASSQITEEMARMLRRDTGFKVTTGYVEQEPFLEDVARQTKGPAFCLPFFATRAGHVSEDLPQALKAAGFTGPLLPAIGEHPDCARLIANTLIRHSQLAAA